MSWSDRQRAMLEAMGLKLWLPPEMASSPAHAQPAGATRTGAITAAAASAQADAAASDVAVAETPAAHASAPQARPGPAGAVAVPTATPVSATSSATLGTPSHAPSHAPARRAADALPREVLARAQPAAAPHDAMPTRVALAPATVADLDWSGLRAAVAGCQACTLCASRQQTVFGVGNERAHWMIVGEAPGEQEDQRGEPFVGPAGKLLDSMLRSIGLTRGEAPPEQQVFIANTLKCRPPRNRNPDPAELAQCEPFLQRQIELIQPRIILAMGRFAVQQLLRSQEAIGRLRGRVHRYQGVPLVVTYHPAYLLRNLPDKARAWEDLCLARRTLEESGTSAPGTSAAGATDAGAAATPPARAED